MPITLREEEGPNIEVESSDQGASWAIINHVEVEDKGAKSAQRKKNPIMEANLGKPQFVVSDMNHDQGTSIAPESQEFAVEKPL